MRLRDLLKAFQRSLGSVWRMFCGDATAEAVRHVRLLK